jgi:hypothetical protein
MTFIEITDGPGRVPPDDPPFGSFFEPPFEPPPDDPSFLPPPEFDTLPDPRTLSPHVQRQMLLGRFLDDAEVEDRQLAVSAARRAVSIEELRRMSVAIAAEEEAEDRSRPVETGRAAG